MPYSPYTVFIYSITDPGQRSSRFLLQRLERIEVSEDLVAMKKTACCTIQQVNAFSFARKKGRKYATVLESGITSSLN